MEKTFYEKLGGDTGVLALVTRFYDLMEQLPEARHLRDIHPPDLTNARERLYLFLCGWLGGPNRYVEQHGHPRLKMRHAPFPVDARARDEWMLCMTRALADVGADEESRARLTKGFADLAEHMRNR